MWTLLEVLKKKFFKKLLENCWGKKRNDRVVKISISYDIIPNME